MRKKRKEKASSTSTTFNRSARLANQNEKNKSFKGDSEERQKQAELEKKVQQIAGEKQPFERVDAALVPRPGVAARPGDAPRREPVAHERAGLRAEERGAL